ncbi:MAG TPA: cyclic nucleotide-binding domain-containing protein [Verrucomicrobiae bacterium]|nr:cyclic nucleotide-binding domain-containing protein [Verrucomicrobiae bacterium]
METGEAGSGFFIWGVDQSAYGPVELPTLVNWIRDDRVVADTWIFAQQSAHWQPAAKIPELQMFFHGRSSRGASSSLNSFPGHVRPSALRRVKILANLGDDQLERFAQLVDFEKVAPWTAIVKKGEHGDSMYLILEGEARVRLMEGHRETILATLGPGEFFGDISLFDHGPRSADVIANTDTTVAKISAENFEKLSIEAPDLAVLFLTATVKTLAARIRADNKRLSHSVASAQAVEA